MKKVDWFAILVLLLVAFVVSYVIREESVTTNVLFSSTSSSVRSKPTNGKMNTTTNSMLFYEMNGSSTSSFTSGSSIISHQQDTHSTGTHNESPPEQEQHIADRTKDTEKTKVIAERQQRRNITLIVELRGELGNHLALLANARITQLLVEQSVTKYSSYIHHIHIVGQHQNHPKWKHAYHDLMNCFPQFHDFTFTGGNQDTTLEDRDDFRTIAALQASWLTTAQQQLLMNPREEGLDFLLELLQQQEIEQHQNMTTSSTSTNNSSTGTSTLPPRYTGNSTKYSLPYLITNDFVWEEILYNTTYYNTIRHYLRFNTSSPFCCCNSSSSTYNTQQQLPQPPPRDNTTTGSTNNDHHHPEKHEIVYHHRNFMVEMKDRAKGNHYTEATPETVVQYMFGNRSRYNTNTTTNIAIASRYQQRLEPYVMAIQNTLGIPTRVIGGSEGGGGGGGDNHTTTTTTTTTGVQDFCYLLQTPYELIGKYHSTFVRYAALLGQSQHNRFYGLNLNTSLDHSTTTMTNYTSATHPIHLLEYIEQSNRTFVSEQYWQPTIIDPP